MGRRGESKAPSDNHFGMKGTSGWIELVAVWLRQYLAIIQCRRYAVQRRAQSCRTIPQKYNFMHRFETSESKNTLAPNTSRAGASVSGRNKLDEATELASKSRGDELKRSTTCQLTDFVGSKFIVFQALVLSGLLCCVCPDEKGHAGTSAFYLAFMPFYETCQ